MNGDNSADQNDFNADSLLVLLVVIFICVSCAEIGEHACGCLFWILLTLLGVGALIVVLTLVPF